MDLAWILCPPFDQRSTGNIYWHSSKATHDVGGEPSKGNNLPGTWHVLKSSSEPQALCGPPVEFLNLVIVFLLKFYNFHLILFKNRFQLSSENPHVVLYFLKYLQSMSYNCHHWITMNLFLLFGLCFFFFLSVFFF